MNPGGRLKITFLSPLTDDPKWEGSENTVFPGDSSYIKFYVWLLVEYKREINKLPFNPRRDTKPEPQEVCLVCEHVFEDHTPFCRVCLKERGWTAKHEFVIEKDTGIHPYVRGVFSEEPMAYRWKESLEKSAKDTWGHLPPRLRPKYLVEETVANHLYAGADIYAMGQNIMREPSIRK